MDPEKMKVKLEKKDIQEFNYQTLNNLDMDLKDHMRMEEDFEKIKKICEFEDKKVFFKMQVV